MCLPYFRKSEGLTPSDEIVIDAAAHNSAGPLGVSVRSPVLPASREFVVAAEAAGIPRGDYNGRDRGGAVGVVSLVQTNTRNGKAIQHVSRLPGGRGGEPVRTSRSSPAHTSRACYWRLVQRTDRGEWRRVSQTEWRDRHRLCKQGSDPKCGRSRFATLAAALWHWTATRTGSCRRPLHRRFTARRQTLKGPHPGTSVLSSAEGRCINGRGRHLDGSGSIRQPAGPLPADPRDDEKLPAELQALKQEAERRLAEWATSGCGLPSSSLYEAGAWFSTGLGDQHSHDAQIAFIPCGYNYDLWHSCLNIDTAKYFDDPSKRLAADAEGDDCAGKSSFAAQRR